MAAEVLRGVLQEGVGVVGYPGAIGLVRKGDEVRRVGVGVGEIGGGGVDTGARFRIGSITKMFVVTVLLQLVGEGRVSLEDSVQRWLPGVLERNGYAGERISLRQVLEDSSGVRDYLRDLGFSAMNAADMDPYRVWKPRELVDIATATPPYAAPGAELHYSNTNFVLAGMVIEAVTGQSVESEVRRRIVEPLGLRHTGFPQGPEIGREWLHGYFLARDVSVSNPTMYSWAGAMVSTLDDVAEFARAQQDGRLLAPAQLAQLRTTFKDDGVDSTFALAAYRWDSECGPAWLRTGAVPGYYSLVVTSESGDRQIVLASNEYHLIERTWATERFGTAVGRMFCMI